MEIIDKKQENSLQTLGPELSKFGSPDPLMYFQGVTNKFRNFELIPKK